MSRVGIIFGLGSLLLAGLVVAAVYALLQACAISIPMLRDINSCSPPDPTPVRLSALVEERKDLSQQILTLENRLAGLECENVPTLPTQVVELDPGVLPDATDRGIVVDDTLPQAIDEDGIVIGEEGERDPNLEIVDIIVDPDADDAIDIVEGDGPRLDIILPDGYQDGVIGIDDEFPGLIGEDALDLDPNQLAEIDEEELEERIEESDAQEGELAIRLAWNGYADLDLIVTCPAGEMISYSRKRACRGRLDVDANSTTQTRTDRPIENIFFEDPYIGVYQIRVSLYGSAAQGVVPFTLIIKAGTTEREVNGTVRTQDKNWDMTFDYGT